MSDVRTPCDAGYVGFKQGSLPSFLQRARVHIHELTMRIDVVRCVGGFAAARRYTQNQ